MSRGNISFLGQNPDCRILTDQIFGRNDFAGGTIMVPFKIEFSGSIMTGNRFLESAETLILKGELRTEKGLRVSENTILENYRISNNQKAFESQFQFSFSNDVIYKIESERKGDLMLSLSIVIEAVLYEGMTFSNSQQRNFISGINKGGGHVQFQIPQSVWINKILPQIGHDSFRLIEIPSMSHLIPGEYSLSICELEEAKKYFLLGEYDKTVAHCRSALDPFKAQKDELRTFIKSKSEFSWVNEVLTATDEWLNKLVKSTSHFTSKAHHIPSTGHFGRSEAEIIMMVTVALIAYIGKL
jgi:hypothetical protein